MLNQQEIIFFDGICGLCNKFVDFIIARDAQQKFYFSPLTGTTAQKKLGNLPIQVDTVILFSKGKIYIKSNAAIRILSGLGGGWKLTILLLVIPNFIRNYVYDQIAKNRYRWFGKLDSCRIPTAKERKQFLD